MAHEMNLKGDIGRHDNAKRITLANDIVFAKVLENENISRPLLEAIIGEKIGEIRLVYGQRTVESFDKEHSVHKVVYDVILESTGLVVNVELQRSMQKDIACRARLYSSLLDKDYHTKYGLEKYDLPESYVVFFQKGDILHKGLPIYNFATRDDYGNVLSDGRHICFINYNAYTSFVGELGQVCEMLATGDSEGDFATLIKDEIGDLVERTEWREIVMSYEEKRQDWIAYGREEGHEEGREEGMVLSLRDTILSMRRAGVSAEVAWGYIASAVARLSEESAKQLHDLAFQ